MLQNTVVLANNVSNTGATDWTQWPGGYSGLVVNAGTFPTTLNLEMLGGDGLTAIVVNSTNIQANGLLNFEIPRGQVRMNLTGGSPAGLYASLSTVPIK